MSITVSHDAETKQWRAVLKLSIITAQYWKEREPYYICGSSTVGGPYVVGLGASPEAAIREAYRILGMAYYMTAYATEGA